MFAAIANQIRFAATVRALLLLLASCCAGSAAATQYCVTSHTGLRDALDGAESNAADDEIRIHDDDILAVFASTIAFSVSLDDVYDIDISGGWNAGCTAQSRASRTRIVADSQQVIQLLRVDLGPNAEGTLRLSNLAFVSGKTLERGGCLQVMSALGARAHVVIERAKFFQCRARFGAAAAIDTDAGKLTFRGNMVGYNTTEYGAGALHVGNGSGDVYVHNNTFVGNGLSAGHVRDVQFHGDNLFFAYNNIFDSTLASGDVNLHVTADTVLVRNMYRGLGGTPDASSSGNLVGVDPRFAPGSITGLLTATSPARNSGTNAMLGGMTTHDLGGMPRVTEGTVDRGAYEFQHLFANSFE